MNRHKPAHELQARLTEIDEKILSHPLSADRVKDAHATIEEVGKSNKEEVEKTLKERGLPDLKELGKIQLKHTFSWWRLHRQRQKTLNCLGDRE